MYIARPLASGLPALTPPPRRRGGDCGQNPSSERLTILIILINITIIIIIIMMIIITIIIINIIVIIIITRLAKCRVPRVGSTMTRRRSSDPDSTHPCPGYRVGVGRLD